MCAAVASLENGPRPPFQVATSRLKNKLPLLSNHLQQSAATGCLSPDVKSLAFTPQLCTESGSSSLAVKKIGRYLLLEQLAACTGTVETRSAVDTGSGKELICRIFPLNKYRETLAPYWQSGHHDHIADIVEIVLGSSCAYVFFHCTHEDLHSYIRRKRRLAESEAARLFQQIVSVVKHCHKRGIVLRDLKLRKFVFADQERTHLLLDGLEDAVLLDDVENDKLTDKHGCPAYVSPEILSSRDYSGRAADMWSLGVILYTMLFGQYPFHDSVASQLFGKIRRGHYTVPDSVSAQARCLVRSLLRTEPTERLTVFEAARHPWFDISRSHRHSGLSVSSSLVALSAGPRTAAAGKEAEQRVPELVPAATTVASQLLDLPE
jgi:tribbles homolog 1/2